MISRVTPREPRRERFNKVCITMLDRGGHAIFGKREEGSELPRRKFDGANPGNSVAFFPKRHSQKTKMILAPHCLPLLKRITVPLWRDWKWVQAGEWFVLVLVLEVNGKPEDENEDEDEPRLFFAPNSPGFNHSRSALCRGFSPRSEVAIQSTAPALFLPLLAGLWRVVGHALLAASSSDVRMVFLRQPLREFGLLRGEFRIRREVFPLIRIAVILVEFLVAIGVVNVAHGLGADGVVVAKIRRNRGLVPRRARI